jgi:hypothetical protein
LIIPPHTLVVFRQPFDGFYTLPLGEMFPDGNRKLPVLPPPIPPRQIY